MNDPAGKGISPSAVRMAVGRATLRGDLAVPPGAEGLVLFVHGSGSSRLSSRNRFVARHLQNAGLATLLFDLLTEREERIDQVTLEFRFAVGLLAERLAGVTDWVASRRETRELALGYFGASTGAAAALVAETRNPAAVQAIVCRGGRPDLAGPALSLVQAPTLLIVGERDHQVILLNELAMGRLTAVREMVIVPRATHLFEEPGALEAAARLASRWFQRYLCQAEPDRPVERREAAPCVRG